MALYENFPSIDYNGYIVKDITVRLSVMRHLKNIVSVYENYVVENDDTPEIVAHKFYNDAELHWLILLMNDIIDPLFDWPLSNGALDVFITNKYGVGNEDNPHHFESDGRVVYYVPADPATPYVGLPLGYSLVTNREHETIVNEEKRKIKILDKKYISDIESEIRRALNA